MKEGKTAFPINCVLHGDAIDLLRQYPENTFDAVVTDPPYGLGKEADIYDVLKAWMKGEEYDPGGGGFMGKRWDSFVPSPVQFREIYRVLKPGGYILCFAAPRTADLMGLSLRMAGFTIRDTLQWIFGNGFPKSHNIAKAIDKTLGHEPVIVETRYRKSGGFATIMRRNQELGYRPTDYYEGKGNIIQVTRPATKEAREWEGWGTSLKPAYEPIILAQKPTSERTIAMNVLGWGTGGMNIDASRVPMTTEPASDDPAEGSDVPTPQKPRRFPASVLLDGEAAQLLDLQSGNRPGCKTPSSAFSTSIYRPGRGKAMPQGPIYGDSGGAPRFFYVSKASTRERTMNGRVQNNHPTVKPLALMRYLVRLVARPGGVVLDPFCGSGTTLLACIEGGWSYVGIDSQESSVSISRARITYLLQDLAKQHHPIDSSFEEHSPRNQTKFQF